MDITQFVGDWEWKLRLEWCKINIGKACAIFEQIESERYADEEKLLAISEVIEMPTHNGVTKDTILNAFRWLWNYAIEEVTEWD